jgi:SAM-dependent methyltransferase
MGPKARGVERGLAPGFRALLVPRFAPRVAGVVAMLEAGIGRRRRLRAGTALLTMAKAYPNSRFHGYDISQHALVRAEANRKEAGLGNAKFHDALIDPLPEDGRFGFVTTFDCLHDMTDPAAVICSIRRSLRDDGIWFVADIKAMPTYEQNVARNPMAAMMYGTSVLTCMSSALSEPGGMGLGTLGLHTDLARKLAADAGFTRSAARPRTGERLLRREAVAHAERTDHGTSSGFGLTAVEVARRAGASSQRCATSTSARRSTPPSPRPAQARAST